MKLTLLAIVFSLTLSACSKGSSPADSASTANSANGINIPGLTGLTETMNGSLQITADSVVASCAISITDTLGSVSSVTGTMCGTPVNVSVPLAL